MKNELIKIWKDNKVGYCEMEFSCGGDSMNEYTFNFFDKNDKKLDTITELENYFDTEVFREVNFYEASDGHYQGEFGKVVIQLNEEDDDEEEHGFSYVKHAQSEWSETYSEVIEIELSQREKEILVEYVNNINGGDGDVNFNYKKDFIVTDEISETLDSLGTRVADMCEEHEIEDVEGDYSEWFTFSTDYDKNETNDIIFNDNYLMIETRKQYNVVRDGDDNY